MAAAVEQHGAEPARVRRVGYPRLGPRAGAIAPRPGPAREVLMLARLTRVKGADVLLQAARLAERALGRRLHLTIAGNGPEQPGLERRARHWALDAAFPGWVLAPTRQRLIEQADVVAVPSLWAEPFGMTGIEAAGWGVPAVGFAHGGIPDWLQAGTNGELAPADPPTAAGLAAALTRALGDSGHWNQLRQGAWRRTEEFALEPHLHQLEAIFREVVT
jgi:glycosyltransferase involved in cell wall biosynthesis